MDVRADSGAVELKNIGGRADVQNSYIPVTSSSDIGIKKITKNTCI